MRPLLAAVLAAGVLALAACSSEARPGAAAVIDGEVVDASQVERIAEELTPLASTRQGAAAAAIQLLAVGDDVRRLAREQGTVVSTTDARETYRAAFDQQGLSVDDLSEDSLEVLATATMAQQLEADPEGSEALTEVLTGIDGEINPRYGTANRDDIGRFFVDAPRTPWVAGDTGGAVPAE